ncbi:MAG TPA: ABC transporter permease [Lachnospiraceae bacterium]|nr:ABC transporter permease [Lachnospiraceae bacterium]
MSEIIIKLFIAAILAGTPLLFGTVGEILTEKSGNLNLGVEGMMFMGGVVGLAGSYYYEQLVINPVGWVSITIAIICAFLCGAFGAFIYGVLTISFHANQNVTGLALTIFGTGFGNFFGEVMGNASGASYVAVSATTKLAFSKGISGLSAIPVVGPLLFSYNVMVYLAIAIAVIMSWILSHTRVGLNLRAVGENPATADATGINVTRYKYISTCMGGGICALGGLYIVMVTCSGVWVNNCISGYGWLALALVIFATWSPLRAMICALVFGVLSVMRLYVPLGIPMQIYDIFPYIATVIVLVAVSFKKNRENQPPASLGNAFFREER